MGRLELNALVWQDVTRPRNFQLVSVRRKFQVTPGICSSRSQAPPSWHSKWKILLLDNLMPSIQEITIFQAFSEMH